MPDNAPVTLQPGTLPEGFCFTNFQALLNTFFNVSTAFVSGTYNFFNYGSSTPGVNDRSKPWFRLEGSGAPDRWYVFFDGKWVSPHAVPQNSKERRIWTGTTGELTTYDGGDANPIGDASGPMWEVDTAFATRMPVGVGTFPNLGTVLNVTDTGGEDKHLLTTAEMPAHQHSIPNAYSAQCGTGASAIVGFAGTGPNVVAVADINTSSTGGGTSHNNEPLYYVVYFIRRTARKFYSV